MNRTQLKQLIKEVVKETVSTNPTPEQKQSALDIKSKLNDKMRIKGKLDYDDIEAVRQMVEIKLAKEGWMRSTGDEEPIRLSGPSPNY
jgi:hypothetical protein